MRKTTIAFGLAFFLLSQLYLSAAADGDAPDFIVTDVSHSEGQTETSVSIDTSQLTPAGTVAINVNDLNLPPAQQAQTLALLGAVNHADPLITNSSGPEARPSDSLVYQVFTTTGGQTVVLPDQQTQTVISLTGVTGLQGEASYALTNGYNAEGAAQGNYSNFGIDAQQAITAAGGDPTAMIDQASMKTATVYQNAYDDYMQSYGNSLWSHESSWLEKLTVAIYTPELKKIDAQREADIFVDGYTSAYRQYLLNSVVGVGNNPNSNIAFTGGSTLWRQLNAELNDPNSALHQGLPGQSSRYGTMLVFDGQPFQPCCRGNGPTASPRPDKGERDDWPVAGKPIVNKPKPKPPVAVAPAPTSPPVVKTVAECPRNLVIAQADPASTVRANKIAPNFPVVVGQDPNKTGVTLGVSMSVPPVYVSYNVLTESSETSCGWGGYGYPGDNCEGKGSEWRTSTVITRKCERVTETYTDRLANIGVSMNLAQSSIDWITGELAVKYPGARVYQENWNLFPGTRGAGGFISDNTGFSYQWDALQTRDPGKYIVNVNGSTTGTQYTGPRGFSFSQETFSVDLLEVALTK